MIGLYIILFLTVIASGSLIFIFKTDNQKILKLMLAFSGAFLIGISFLKLVPEVFSSSLRFAGLFVIMGYLIQLVLELITEGVEHGHSHIHREDERATPFILLIGLCIHAFLEGTPISSGIEADIRRSLIIGIIVHNIPISVTLMGLLLHYGCSWKKGLFYLTVFALMTPLGSIISNLIPFASSVKMQHFFTYIMAVVIGIFLHVSTSILFEAEDNHQYNVQKFVVVCFGIAVSAGLTFL
jgi:zinc and cadmium transporter